MIWTYVFKRLAYGLLVAFLVVLVISTIIYKGGVDPARMTFGQHVDELSIEAKRKAFGLDKPWYIQQLSYVNDLSPIAYLDKDQQSSGNYTFLSIFSTEEGSLVVKKPYFRNSYQSGEPVLSIIGRKMPETAILAFTAILFAIVIGIVLGILSAVKRGSWFDHTSIITSVLGYSLPSYVTAMLIAIVFGFYWHQWTGLRLRGTLFGIDDYSGERVFQWRNLILPAIALGIRPVAIITQLTRSTMLDVLSQDYIRTAKAKGLSHLIVITKHALKNALNPVVTAASGWFASLLVGAFFVEMVFDYNGLGKETINAIRNYDVPVILGIVILGSFLFVIINILVDLLYLWLSPQAKLS